MEVLSKFAIMKFVRAEMKKKLSHIEYQINRLRKKVNQLENTQGGEHER